MAEIPLTTNATIPSGTSIEVTVKESTSFDAATDSFTEVYETPNLQAHQGYTTDGEYHYSLDTAHIYKWDDSWTIVEENASPLDNLPSEVNHLGDGYYYAPGDELHVPAEEWNGSSDYGSPHIAVYDAADLSYKTDYSIDNGTDEAAGVWIDGGDGIAWIANYVDNATPLYKYNLSDYSYTSESFSPNSPPNQVQGVYQRNGYWYLPSNDSNSTHVVDVSAGDTVKEIAAYSGGAYEGVDYSDGTFRVLHDPNSDSTGTVHFHNQEAPIDNTATQTLDDGENSYTLSGFDGSGGNLVWADTSYSGDGGDTPTLDSIELS